MIELSIASNAEEKSSKGGTGMLPLIRERNDYYMYHFISAY